MDNKTYLDQIAVKGESLQKTTILSPGLIKLILGAFVALIAILVIAAILNSTNNRPKDIARDVFVRMNAMSAEEGPLAVYSRNIKDSKLRNYGNQLRQALRTSISKFSPVLETMGVSVEFEPETDGLTNGTTEDKDAVSVGQYKSELHDARLKGLLDRQFASKTSLQITYILNLQYELRDRTKNEELAAVIDASSKDLEELQNLLTKYDVGQQ